MICLLRVSKNLKKLIKKTNSAVDEALIKNKRRIVQYIIAIRSTLVDNKEQARLEKHYGFQQEDITKEMEIFFSKENKQSYDGVHDQSNRTE